MKTIIILMLLSVSSIASEVVSGFYQVPEPQGIDFEGLNLFRVNYKLQNGEKLKYRIPVELTGVPQSIEIKKSIDENGKEVWMGEKAKGTCVENNGLFSCKLNYKNLDFDPIAREHIIANRLRDIKEQDILRRVAITFESEPIGIISYIIKKEN